MELAYAVYSALGRYSRITHPFPLHHQSLLTSSAMEDTKRPSDGEHNIPSEITDPTSDSAAARQSLLLHLVQTLDRDGLVNLEKSITIAIAGRRHVLNDKISPVLRLSHLGWPRSRAELEGLEGRRVSADRHCGRPNEYAQGKRGLEESEKDEESEQGLGVHRKQHVALGVNVPLCALPQTRCFVRFTSTHNQDVRVRFFLPVFICASGGRSVLLLCSACRYEFHAVRYDAVKRWSLKDTPVVNSLL